MSWWYVQEYADADSIYCMYNYHKWTNKNNKQWLEEKKTNIIQFNSITNHLYEKQKLIKSLLVEKYKM